MFLTEYYLGRLHQKYHLSHRSIRTSQIPSMHYELNTGALLSAAIGQSLLGNWSTATEFHLSHRWEPGIRPQLTINSWLWAEKGVAGLWEVVVKGSVCWEVTVIQVSSSCSLLHSFLPHWRAGHIHALQFRTFILQVGAMYEMQVQCKFLLWWLHLRILPGAHPHHLLWRTLHICLSFDNVKCQPEISAPYPSIIFHINSPQLL